MNKAETHAAVEHADAARRTKKRVRLMNAAIAGLMVFDTGCFTYQPIVGTSPQPGQRLSFELSDQGRAALADQLGPGILRVEGLLQEMQGEQYVVSVSKVESINNGSADWGGERVKIPKSDVSRTSLRTLSKGKTFAVIGVSVVAIGAFIITRSFGGGGFSQDTTGTGGPVSGK